MNAMEGRTRDAMHRVADGLLVSAHDLDRLEEDLMTRLDPDISSTPQSHGGSRLTDGSKARSRRWVGAVAAVAALVLVVGGVALWRDNRQTTPPVSPTRTGSQPLVPPELVGLWQNVPESRWLWEFAADGRFGYTENAAAYLRGEALSARIAKRDGEVYTVLDTEKNCSMQWRIRVVRPEAVDVAVSNDTCGDYAAATLSLVRVSPRDPAAAPFRSWFPLETERAVTLVEQLEGSWVNPDTDLVLVVAAPKTGGGLTYLLDDDGDGSVRPDQRGVLTVAADGSTVPQPDPAFDDGCAPLFTKLVTDTATLTTTSGKDGCFPAGSTQTWQRLN